MEVPKPYTFTLDLVIPDVSILFEKHIVSSTPVLKMLLDWSVQAEIKEYDYGIKWLAVFLRCERKAESKNWPWECKVDFNVILKNRKGDPKMDFHEKIGCYTFTNKESCWGFIRFYKCAEVIDEQKGFVLDNGIHVQIEVPANPPRGLHFEEKTQIQSAFDFSSKALTTRHILRMLEEGEMADVRIAKDGTEVKAHRGILN